MKYVKITIMLRSIDALYEYNKAGRSFWDDFTGLMRGTCADAIVENAGKFRCIYYLPIEETEPIVPQVKDMLEQLGQDPEIFIVGSADISASDIERLKQNNIDNAGAKSWLADAEALLLTDTPKSPAKEKKDDEPAEEKGEEPSSPEASVGTTSKPDIEPDTAEPTDEPAEEPAPKKETPPPLTPKLEKKKEEELPQVPEVADSLSVEAERISALKESLLSVVHGQRHAVDEVVQTIFECDAFNRHNPDRKGPLASFLFTGPSGVGKTFLAMQCAARLGRECRIIDMSEFSDNLSNGKFNGEHGCPNIVTGFVKKNPTGILIFDEIEKAHINTIYLFLQILDAGRLRDIPTNKEVSFKDTIIFITTNAGSSLYSDPTVVDLSNVSRRSILEALRTDMKPGWNNEPYFPECITTRFANGHVILFNHLEPYALMQIVRDEIALQMNLFSKATGVQIEYDPAKLSALVMYSTGGLADARSLRGTAKNMIVKEILDVVLQTYRMAGKGVDGLKKIEISVEPEHCDKDVQELFSGHDVTHVPVFADKYLIDKVSPVLDELGKACNTQYEYFSDVDDLKRRARGIVDYILLDPAAGSRPMTRNPNDIEDIDAEGIDLFHYLTTYYPDIPIYFLDVRGHGEAAFASLLAKGGRGVVELDPEDPSTAGEQIMTLSFSALVNNTTYNLGRSGKILNYNCSQYNVDDSHVIVAFDQLTLDYAPASSDNGVIFGGNERNGVTFKDVIGCKEAKKALGEFCKFVANPRAMISQGKRIPKGVLLYGPPGTGKTMLAKALANEANAAFIPTTATSFFASLVGESEKNVRDLFQRARRYAPSIIFIDEVDAVARTRTGSIGSTHNEDVLNALIAEMDGFSTDERRPVFVLAATNYDVNGEGPRVLDPAFVRRFDRKIFVDLPDTDDRYQLLMKELERHSVHFGEDHEAIVKNLAERSSGLSNADLTIILDIFLRACEDKDPTPAALMDALDNFRFGETNELSEKDLEQTACHESGHALVARLLGETPAFLTIVSRGNYGGFMEHSHDEKKAYSTFKELMDRVCISLAGRVAEMEVYGMDAGLNTGASSDLANARFLVKIAVNEYGMGKKLFTKGTDEDFEAMMQEQYERTVNLIKENRPVLEKLTKLLAKQKSLNKTELEKFFSENL